MKPLELALIGIAVTAAIFMLSGTELALMKPNVKLSSRIDAEIPSDLAPTTYEVAARDGWWSDVLILSDGSGPSSVLKDLSPDALNWAYYSLPSFLADLGTKYVRSTAMGYQESEEIDPGDVQNWNFASSLAYDVYDQPIHYTQWGSSYFMDPHSTEWADAVLESMKAALTTSDGVSQDNIGVPPFIKGSGGFSSREKAEFRTFLRESLGAEYLQSVGIEHESFDIAQYIRERDYLDGNPEALDDPVFRTFVAYQYVSNLQVWQGMLAEIGSDADGKIIHGNQYGVWTPSDSNTYSVLLSQLHQVIEIEYVSYLDSMPPPAHGSLIYKLGLASGRLTKPVWIRGIVYDWGSGSPYLRSGHLRLITAEAYANGAVRTFEHDQGTPNGHFSLPETAVTSLLDYYDWLDDNRFLFDRRQPLADVAVVYSIPTMMWRFFPATGHVNRDQVHSMSGIAGVLDREHIPYNVLIFGHPDVWSDWDLPEQLAKYDTLILPDVDCLSDDQVVWLEDYVASGGRVLYSGEFGTRDENLAWRESSQLDTLLTNPNVVGLEGTPGRSFYEKAVLNGRSASQERASIASHVLEMLGDDLSLETETLDTVSINTYMTDAGLYGIHFLNLNYDRGSDLLVPTGPFDVKLKLPPQAHFQDRILYFFSDDGTSAAIPAESDGQWLSVTIPGVATHAVLSAGDLTAAVSEEVESCIASLARSPWAAARQELVTEAQLMNERADAGDWLGALEACGKLEDMIANSSPSVLFDFSHSQDSALTEEDARTINWSHPEWHTLEELANSVTQQVDERPLSDDVLSEVNVLVVAVHKTAFSQAEIATVERFVSAGGGLLFIGNGGSSPASLALTSVFGLEFLPYSALAATDHLWDIVSFDVADVTKHQITSAVNSLQLNYACPMAVDSEWTVIASTATEVWQETGSDERQSPEEQAGPFPVVAFRPYGSGRIAAVCDDAPFRAWGSQSLVHNLIQWLAGG